jgi:glucoside 3-dehydrogenase (cytochrome c) hitch-hiker subunit
MTDRANNPKQGRREALKNIMVGAGGLTALPILGQSQPAGAPQSPMKMDAGSQAATQPDAKRKPLFFDEHQNETVVVLTELIIPETDTPGAKAALVNRYIDLLYNEEEPAEQERLIRGLAWLDGRSFSLHNKPFVRLRPEEQTAILERLADPNNTNPEDQLGVEFFQLIKSLTIFGFYTSQIGLDQELQYGGDRYNTSFPGACTHPEHQT